MRNIAKITGLVFSVVLLLSLALTVGCSDEQKDDAARLEQEVLDQGADGTTTASSAADTTAPAAEVMDVEAVPEEEPVSYEPVGSGYAVQVASCEDQAYAEWLVERFTKRGYTTYMAAYNHMGQAYFRVRLGPYETNEGAEQVKADLIDKYSLETWIAVE